MRYLLTNLRVQAIVIGAACVSMAALAVVLIQDALGSAAQRLLAEAAHQCRNAAAELRVQWLEQQAYRSEPTGPLPFAARDLSLRGLTRTVPRSFEGVQGGFWLPEEGGVIGFSDPSVEEDANPQLASGAWLATLAHEAASGEVQVRTWESGYEGFALAVEPSADGIAAWASKRLPDLRDPVGRTRRWWAAGLLSCALLAVGGVISITLRLQRNAASLSAGLQRMEQDLDFRLPPIGGDFGTIAEAVNRMADRRTGLESALRRQDRLAAHGRVAAGVAHEIRNPLNSLRLTMELLRRRTARTGSPTGEAEAAVHEIGRLDDILSRFLAFGRQELGARKVQPVAPLLERVQRIAQSAAADVPALAAHLVDRLARRLRLPASPLAPEAVRILRERDWPGNVRELEHCLERALILSRGGPILPEHLDVPASSPAQAHFDALDLSVGFHELVSKLERRLIERALEASGGNKTKAAEILRINRRLLYDKLEEFGLS
jgi:signal transduction histidine kinase